MSEKVDKNKIVKCDFEMQDEHGQILDDNQKSGPFVFTYGANQIPSVLEKSFYGHEEGDKFHITFKGQELFGTYQPELRKAFHHSEVENVHTIQLGDLLQLETKTGPRLAYVVDKSEDQIVLEANHPLLDKTLTFYFSITEILPEDDSLLPESWQEKLLSWFKVKEN